MSGANATNGTILWTKNGAGSITSGSTTLTPTYTPTAADAGNTVTLTMTVTSTNACAPQTATATYTVIVNPLPTATAGGSKTICSNATATVSGANATNGAILWTKNGAGSITSGATTLTPTYTPTAADAGNTVTLTMTVTSTNACAPQTATATYSVIVNPLPTATAGGTQTICSNATATVSGANATYGSILWTENGAGSINAGSTTLTPTYSANAADAGKTITLTMKVTSTNACAPQTATATYTVIVNPLPTATAGGSKTICSNATATVNGATATNGNISWTTNGAGSITAGATTLTPTYTPTAADAGNTVTLTMTVTSTIACTPAITATATYTVIVNPLPTAAAGGSKTICSNATATVSGASATNGNISWTTNGAGSITSGSTTLTPTYTPTTADAGNTVTLTMTVTSTIACTPAITATAIYSIIVNATPIITSQPVSPAAICTGTGSRTFSVTATGATTYQWRKGGTILTNGGIYSGVNTSTLTITNPTVAENGASYTVVVGNAAGCIVTSNPGTITVTAVPIPKIEFTQGSNDKTFTINACGIITGGGQNDLDISSGNPGGSATYQWQVSTNGGTTWFDGPGPTSTTTQYVLDPLYTNYESVAGTYKFKLIISNNGCSGISDIITLTVTGTSNLTPGTVGSDQSSCGAATINPVSFTVITAPTGAGGNGSYIYQWQSSIDNTNFTFINGATSSVYDAPSINQTTYYRRVVVSGGCSAISNTITVYVLAPPTITSQPTGTICSGIAQNYTITSSLPSNYTWTRAIVTGISNGLGSGATSALTETLNNTTNTAIIVLYIITPKIGSCSGPAFNYDVTVTPLPTLTLTSAAATANQTVCATSSIVNITYSVSGSATSATVTGLPTGITGTFSGGIFTISGSPDISQNGLANFTVTTSGGCSPNKTLSGSITVNTLSVAPVTITGSTTICAGGSTTLTLSGGTAGTGATAQWFSNSCGGTAAGTGNSITVSPANTTTYYVRYNGTCNTTTCKSVTVTVNTISVAPTSITGNNTICTGGSTTLTLSGGTAGTGATAQWFTGSCGGASSGTGNSITVSPASNTTYYVRYNGTCNTTTCASVLVTVLNGTPGLWTGLVSTDWFDCLNWSGGLPSNTINAVINSGNPRMPKIDPASSNFTAAYSNIASAQDLIITSGASVTMASVGDSDLQISRDWKNSGVFIPGSGTVTFNGGNANQIQTINLGIKTNETFYNLKTSTTGTAKGISVVNQFELTVQNQLNLLKGNLRLTGEAQLVQNNDTSNPIDVQGILLIDQQGQKNSFNYNYWSSPVRFNTTSYSIASVLRDGTDVTTNPFNPALITFTDGAFSADTPATNPITISNRWLWAFNSPSLTDPLLNYYQWKYIGSTGAINIGEGFTMKGNGGVAAITAFQNYVFVGIPNSGTIQLPISANQSYLVGNPYPSALDAKQFIRDNLRDCSGCTNSKNIFNGALYYWDHFGLSNNHNLAEYEGGYATYTLMGGVAGINDSSLTLNNGASGSKIPKQYIPVAQGFFVDAFLDTDISGSEIPTSVDGGTLVFKNSQRQFVRESSGNSLFMKTNSSTKTNSSEIDDRAKIRLGFDSAIGAHRQLLVGIDPNTTNQFDIGYDAPMYDLSDDDMYWKMNNTQLIIEGVPNFNNDQVIPIGINIANEGDITIKTDVLENIPNTLEIYLYDNATGIYHDIKNSNLTLSLLKGKYTNRFSLHFANKTLSVDKVKLNDGILVYFTNDNKVLNIDNNFIDATVDKVYLFNILGQKIEDWTIDNGTQASIKLPIKNVRTGVYIVKIQTSKGNFSKNIIVH